MLQPAELDQELRVLELALEALRTKVDYLLLQSNMIETNSSPSQLIGLKGIWHNLDLSLEEIQSAEYHLPEVS